MSADKMNPQDKIFIAGHRGMLGSAILRKLRSEGFSNFALRSSSELDLRSQDGVARFFEEEKPDHVFLAAARVGEIWANDTKGGEFIYDNLQIQNNIIHQSYLKKVKKLLFLGSSCIYPRMAPQPLKEEYLLSGYLEPTNEPYAIAKIAGIKMCDAYRTQFGCNFISVMPTNLYGPGDNYDLMTSHVLPALIRKYHEAKENGRPTVELWGTGTPKREFMFVDDAAAACFFLMQNWNGKGIVNAGTGEDLSIRELAELVREIVGFSGETRYDASKPDGTPRKLLDVSKLHELGFKHSTSLRDGINIALEDFKKNFSVASKV